VELIELVKNPVVEIDGDEMTRIIWKKIKDDVRLDFHLRLTGIGLLMIVYHSIP